MRLYEHEAKTIFRKFGIPVPQGRVVITPAEARETIIELNKPVVLKAQGLVGSRGKAGGIKFAGSPQEARREALQLLRAEIAGCKINKLLVEERLNIAKELYLGVTVDQ
jgi:succinyl-CoA synthetase beta subunit